MRLLFRKLLTLRPVHWHQLLEQLGTLQGYFVKVILLVTDGLTKEDCIGAYLLARSTVRLAKRSGILHTALYLKQCASCLQRAYALSFSFELLFGSRRKSR